MTLKELKAKLAELPNDLDESDVVLYDEEYGDWTISERVSVEPVTRSVRPPGTGFYYMGPLVKEPTGEKVIVLR